MTDREAVSALVEIEAMKKVSEALEGLDSDSINRVLSWANSHYGVTRIQPVMKSDETRSLLEAEDESSDPAAIFTATNPKTEAEKALVIGYWLQFVNGESSIDGNSINSELKNLGHGLSNVTRAMGSLMKRKPQLAVQIKKSGKTKQARKQYRITNEGKQFVEKMAQGEE